MSRKLYQIKMNGKVVDRWVNAEPTRWINNDVQYETIEYKKKLWKWDAKSQSYRFFK